MVTDAYGAKIIVALFNYINMKSDSFVMHT